MRSSIPIIDISHADQTAVATQLHQACCDHGFFYLAGHGIDEALQARLEQISRRFFAQPLATKMQIAMARGGKAWRGYFPVGGELTSGQPDWKEGLYFGAELSDDHPLPLHGANLFPDNWPELRETVLTYLNAMTELGHRVMRGIALSLGLEDSYFAARYTGDPLILFRIFNYPAQADANGWGVGEHTDYGLLTILKQDDCGGLQVKTRSGWIAAPPIPDTFVCNIGDMLDRLTGGLYRSTPHRVRNVSGRDRLSFPFFFDPNWHAEIEPIAHGLTIPDDRAERWDHTNVHEFRGTYGAYLLGKVSKVFPQLQREVL
ncbi:MAG TPA: 2-oxoglutarate and iron-dependent oxygenase domain-containing protein [Blastocatellia bacterium]|nr:2-oxoglutarate and iron-dependent oxygenase domain-containing protein [Blastocatellia bacterium]